ncbi:MAG: hypothetical protein PHN92_06425 [Geobacter sp.]|nr:hypothetical protein [Geobacter sp.]
MKTITARQIKLFLFLGYLSILALLVWYDQPLSAEAHKLLQRPATTIAEGKNAYYYLIGLNFPATSDPAAEGKTLVAWYNKTVLQDKQFADFYQYPPDFEKKRNALRVKGSVPRFHEDDKNNSLFEFAENNPQKLQELLRNNTLLLSRYRALLTYRHYSEPLELGIWTPLPSSTATLELHRLYLLSLGQQAHQGNLAAAVQGVQQTMEFWQAMAEADTSLLMKLHAFSALQSTLYLAAELASTPTITPDLRHTLAQLLQFDTSTLQSAEALRAEAIWAERTMATFRQLAKASSNPANWLLLAWLKPNTMANQLYVQYRHDAQIAGMTAPELAGQLQKNGGNDPIQVRKFDLPFIYSPLGEAQAIKSYSLQYTGYTRKLHNLEGIRRLALLKLQVSEKKITPATMTTFLKTAGPELCDPYSGRPMTWFTDRKSIGFVSPGMEKPLEMRVL